ncbi:endonuclease/exonuclease/phosphatase family protein [Thermophagus sp. OGC60D27]|uniref:endonuclease/exonuclease/phosphatase family protein n=1 Tax=Thermophagus sp. OGC60D27 TaxID=3458415 RepID=UPI004038269C
MLWKTCGIFSLQTLTKRHCLARVIAKIGSHEKIEGPAILGVSEIENRSVLEDLVQSEHLRKLKYQIVHYDSPDRRGVDVALLYQPRYFRITGARHVPLIVTGEDGERVYTRDQLVVSGKFDGDPMHIIVNHWPSRYGGEKISEPLRIAAAELSRSLADSILALHPEDKIVIMGDLNDDPMDKSVKKHLQTSGKPKRIKEGQLYNPMEKLYKKGIGSLAYNGKWNLFDQIIITPNFLEKQQEGYRFHSIRVFNDSFLLRETGKYKKYPHRTFVGNDFQGGYSDHLPVYMIVTKTIQ